MIIKKWEKYEYKKKHFYELLSELVKDPYRPLFHFTCPEGFAQPFDPNGLLYINGRYHLFYIFQNESGHCWGHASSNDLLHWRYHKTALSSNENDVDKGIYSGNGLQDINGTPTLAYFGIDAGICIAQSTDENLNNWSKFKENPVIPIPKEGDPNYGVYNVFDPHMWIEDDTYYIALGGKVKPDNKYDTLFLFKSSDMIHWEYLHQMYKPNKKWTHEYEDCACPDFFKLGKKHALLSISHGLGARIYLGKWENEKFYPESHKRLNYPGGASFAPESVLGSNGRRIYFTWAIDSQYQDTSFNHYSTCMTMPRTLELDEDGDLLIKPIDEISRLRYNHRCINDVELNESEVALPDEFKGNVVEIVTTIDVNNAEFSGLKVLCSPDGYEETRIYYDQKTKELVLDYEKSTSNINKKYTSNIMCDTNNIVITAQRVTLEINDCKKLNLHIFIDRSIIEIYANDRICMTARLFPQNERSLYMKLCGKGSCFKNIDMWNIESTNPW